VPAICRFQVGSGVRAGTLEVSDFSSTFTDAVKCRGDSRPSRLTVPKLASMKVMAQVADRNIRDLILHLCGPSRSCEPFTQHWGGGFNP
jgi:hypothetical protein